MGSSKRKRRSTDSAIADMSGDSFVADSETQASESNAIAQQEKEQQSKRRKESWSLNARDFGTAASQRTRRGATRPTAVPQSLPRKSSLEAVTVPSVASQVKITRESTQEVNGNSKKKKQTPRRKQAPSALPTPPQTAEKTDTQTSPLRRSTRERRPTERSRQALVEQTTPCRNKNTEKIVSVTSDQSEETSATDSRQSCIARLQVASPTHPGDSHMSFTESFSHQQKSGDEQDSQASHEVRRPTTGMTQSTYTTQDTSFVDVRSFQDYGPETFAQPQPEPILADSQDLYSSQLGPGNDDAAEHAAVHLQDHIHSPGETRETSSWTARQDQQEQCASLRSEGFLKHQDQRHAHEPTLQIGAEDDNGSWQTQATIPWKPRSASFHASQATTIDETPIDVISPPSLSKEELREIANTLLACRTYGPPKPEPVGQPTVWADARMELCETLPYFRSYQSACHSTGGFVRGFMFDKVAHVRDYIDSNVLIARAGGGQVRDKESGELKASGDQVEGTTSQNLRNCMSHYNPVVIITGADNPHMPSQPPHQYCVLDYFKPTHIWAEKSGKGKIVRYRFEKLNAQKESWWRAKHIEDSVPLGSLPPPFVKACGTCAKESTQVYLNGWMCLSPSCPSFWLIFPSGPDSLHGLEPSEPDETSLVYDPRFLKSHTPWPNDAHEYPLSPSAVSLSHHAVPGEDTSEAFIRGLVCPKCGRCTSRLCWNGWECPCSWTYTPPHTLIPALYIREPLWPLSAAYSSSRDTHSPLVGVHVSFAHGYRVNRYSIPGVDGFVTHMVANETVVTEQGGPDQMFEELQGMDIGLKRRPIDGGMLKGGMYTRHFAVNYGMPYKFIAATESHPFPEQTHPVCRARRRLDQAAQWCLSDSSSDFNKTGPADNNASPADNNASPADNNASPSFNEVLALGYFESQRISYHDDGESGLGPTIATLSLGAHATMRIRLKPKHHLGVTPAGLYTDTAPVPGCIQHAHRLALVPALQALKRSATASEYRTRLRQIPGELGLKRGGNAREAVTLRLAHGDVVVMHGEALQRYYEHSVEHAGKLRFALTSRFIDPGSVAAGGCGGGVEEGG